MQVLVFDVVLPVGWCSFWFLPGQSFRSLQLLFMLKLQCSAHNAGVGWFSDQDFFYCQTVPGGRGSCILVTTSFEVVVPVGEFFDVQ